MQIHHLRTFLKLFLPHLNSKKDRAAIRFLFKYMKFCKQEKGNINFYPQTREIHHPVVILTKGLVNYYQNRHESDRHDQWVGISGNVIMPECLRGIYSSGLAIEAIEDTEFFVIEQHILENGFRLHPVLNIISFRFLIPRAILGIRNKNFIFRLPALSSRYCHFEKMYPGISARIPKELLDAYLSSSFPYE